MQSKYCKVCEDTKLVSEFFKDKGTGDGFACRCKVCDKAKNLAFSRTTPAMIKRIYTNQIKNGNARGHGNPEYSYEWLENWLTRNPEFAVLLTKWVLDGYDTKDVPSVDRIDDYIGYTKDNIQLTTWNLNRLRGHEDRISGKNGKQNKAVVQMTMDGNEIEVFHSGSEAKRVTGVNNIFACIAGRVSHAGGFTWKYKE